MIRKPSKTRRKHRSRKSRKIRRVQRGGLCPVGCIVDPSYHAPNNQSNNQSNTQPSLTEDEQKCSVNVFTVGARGKTTIFFKDFKQSIKPINDFITSKSSFSNQQKEEIKTYVNSNLDTITSIVSNADKLLKSSLCNEEAKKSIKTLLKPLYNVYPYTLKPDSLKNIMTR